MKKSIHSYKYNYKVKFSNLKEISAFEGGVTYTATKDKKHYLIIDERTLADILDEDDRDLLNQLVKIIAFETEEELKHYLGERNVHNKIFR